MIPVPSPTMLKQIESDANLVFPAYARVVEAALTTLTNRLAKQDTATANTWRDDLDAIVARWSDLAAARPTERSAPADTHRRRARELPDFVTALNKVVRKSTPAEKPTVFPTALKNRWIPELLQLIEDRVVLPIEAESAVAMAALETCFGDKAPQAAPRFREILTQLRQIHSRSDDKTSGFLYNASLPVTMTALGRGAGATACVDLGKGFTPGTISEVKAASTLIHEGSHTLAANPTVDFGYRQANAHYLLPPDMALLNAANYEQVTIDLIGGMPGALSAREVKALRDGAQPALAQVHALLASRVVRTWVRAYDLYGYAAAGTLTPDHLKGLPDMPAGADALPLVTTLLYELFSQIDVLVTGVNDYLALEVGLPPGGGQNPEPDQRRPDQPDPAVDQQWASAPVSVERPQPVEVHSGLRNLKPAKVVRKETGDAPEVSDSTKQSTVTVPFVRASASTPDAVARDIILELATRIWPNKIVHGQRRAFTGEEISHIVGTIQLIDRPELRTMLENYYASTKRKPKIN